MDSFVTYLMASTMLYCSISTNSLAKIAFYNWKICHNKQYHLLDRCSVIFNDKLIYFVACCPDHERNFESHSHRKTYRKMNYIMSQYKSNAKHASFVVCEYMWPFVGVLMINYMTFVISLRNMIRRHDLVLKSAQSLKIKPQLRVRTSVWTE